MITSSAAGNSRLTPNNSIVQNLRSHVAISVATLFFAGLAQAQIVAATGASGPRTGSAAVVTTAPVIDGKLTDDAWKFFNRCYRETYRQHHSTPYLNLDFFRAIGKAMPENIMMVVARREGRPVAASLNIHNGKRLCGRYWGAIEYHPALHFEACYYQAIEFCIARGIATFEGGAQGEHKIARGLMPVTTHSAHWLAHPRFAAAIEDFLARETRGVALHLDELNERSPFRRPPEIEVQSDADRAAD